MALGVALIAVAGILWLWQPARAPAGSAAARPPAAERPAAAAPSAPADQPRPGPGGLAVSIRPVEFNYTVAPGDTLERIAQRYGTTVDAIVGMNNLSDRNVLQPGQKLIIP
jgi:nucleoid-associated protein YgaU